MAINATLRFFGARSPALQQHHGVAACRWNSKQVATTTLQIRQCVGRSNFAFGSVEQESCDIEELNSKQQRQVSLFIDCLLDWNQRMNLTAVTERDAIMERHIVDSLALLPIVESAYSARCSSNETSQERLKVVDVGSGAGLPGLILAIARPGMSGQAEETLISNMMSTMLRFFSFRDGIKFWYARTSRNTGKLRKEDFIDLHVFLCHTRFHSATYICGEGHRVDIKVTLMESLQKRCYFLEHAALESGLSNITIVRARAEECGRHDKFRGAYDIAVARAVAEMRVLSELCLPLVRVGGLFVAAKGPNPEKEVQASQTAIRVLGASLLSISTVASKGPLGLRTAIVCHKQMPTPAKYPRSVGTPGKHPL